MGLLLSIDSLVAVVECLSRVFGVSLKYARKCGGIVWLQWRFTDLLLPIVTARSTPSDIEHWRELLAAHLACLQTLKGSLYDAIHIISRVSLTASLK